MSPSCPPLTDRPQPQHRQPPPLPPSRPHRRGLRGEECPFEGKVDNAYHGALRLRGAKSRRLFRVCHGEDGFVERGNSGNLTDGVESLWGLLRQEQAGEVPGISQGGLQVQPQGVRARARHEGDRDMYRFLLSELRRRSFTWQAPF